VATVVMNTMSVLFPDMSSIAMFFQRVVELLSPSQAILQRPPSLYFAPGAGAVGVTSARTRKGVARTKNATKVFVKNISYLFFCPVGGGGGKTSSGNLEVAVVSSNENRLFIYIGF